MIPWTVLGSTEIPNGGGELKLSQRGHEFSIRLSGVRGELMNSRAHGSEEALSELGCAHIATAKDAQVLVGGLGMGFTLAAALKSVTASATVTVAELIPAVVEWNKGALGECAGQPLQDSRTRVHLGDVADLFTAKTARFDAVLLDVDNGPEGLTRDANDWLYGPGGVLAAYEALCPNGILAVWSAGQDREFTDRLRQAGFETEEVRVRARGTKGSRHLIWLARRM